MKGVPAMTPSIQTGVDIFLQDAADRLQGQRVGLVTNHTGVTRQLEGDVHAFQRVLGKGLCALFGPEHGFYGHVQDRERIDKTTDPESGLPVYSLYGPEESPSETVLRDLDTLIFDIQDVGVRFYTYLTSMYYTMQAAVAHDIPIIILDRPNPITGTRVTGPILSPSWK